MSAILEAPITKAMAETGVGIPPVARRLGRGVRFSRTAMVEREGFFRGDSFRDSRTIHTPCVPSRDSYLLPEPGPLPLDENAASVGHAWPSPRPPIPPSPGEALLEEFDALYQQYERRVYRQCLRMLGNQEDAEDLTQEVFLQLFRKAHTFRGESSFSTWLHRLTVNTVLMRLRRHRRWREVVTSMDVAPGADQGVSDILTMVSTLPAPTTTTLDKISLDVAISQLPSGYKEIFLLHDQEGYRHDEIAKLLGISEGTSKSQLHKARLRLRELIGPAGNRNGSYPRVAATQNCRRRRCQSLPAMEFACA